MYWDSRNEEIQSFVSFITTDVSIYEESCSSSFKEAKLTISVVGLLPRMVLQEVKRLAFWPTVMVNKERCGSAKELTFVNVENYWEARAILQQLT